VAGVEIKRPAPGTAVLLAVRFLSELALLGVLIWVGVEAGSGVPMKILLALALPALAATVWGAVIAPKARRRLPDPARLAVEVVLFVAAAAALAAAGHPVPATAFAVVAIATAALIRPLSPGS
jgi:hypothetical protein